MNCDDDANKPFCGSMGVQGFPTLKIVRPGKKSGKPVVDDYKGQRTTSAMAESVASQINNHVTKLTEEELPKFLTKAGPKAILFTEKGTTSALLKSIAIDFLGTVSIGQLRTKDSAMLEQFGVDHLPALVMMPDMKSNPTFYKGAMKKKDMVEFLKTWAEPNPDPAPAKKKADKKEDKQSKGNKKSKKESEEKQNKADRQSNKESAEKPNSEPKAAPEESADAEIPQATVGEATQSKIPIDIVQRFEGLAETCLRPNSHTCVLALSSLRRQAESDKLLTSLSALNTKYIHGGRHLFPFLSVPHNLDGVDGLNKALGLKDETSLVAMNARRKWLRIYEGDFSETSVEDWLDAIRMGEGDKKKLPADVIVEAAETKAPEETTTEAPEETMTEAAEEESTEATQATDPEPEVETQAPEEHIKDEL